MVYVLLDLFFIFLYFLYVIKVLLIAKVQCVFDCKLTAKKIIPKKKKKKSNRNSNRNKEKRQGNTMCKTPNMRQLKKRS